MVCRVFFLLWIIIICRCLQLVRVYNIGERERDTNRDDYIDYALDIIIIPQL